jgi:hypothetical protein
MDKLAGKITQFRGAVLVLEKHCLVSETVCDEDRNVLNFEVIVLHFKKVLYAVYRVYFYTVKIYQQIHTLLTVIYLCQYHHYMFWWSSQHHQGAPKFTGSVLHLRSKSITFKKQSNVPFFDSTHAPKSLQLK